MSEHKIFLRKGDNMSKSATLASCAIGKTYEICGFNTFCNDTSKELLILLGFYPGETVTPAFTSPFGDPTAYILGCGAQVALRNKEAEYLLVK